MVLQKLTAKLLTLYLLEQLLLHEHIQTRKSYPEENNSIIQKKKRQGTKVIRKNLGFADIKIGPRTSAR